LNDPPDVNVLIYAFRNGMPQHQVCRPWLAAGPSGDARFGLSPMVLSAVVRITSERAPWMPRGSTRRSVSATTFSGNRALPGCRAGRAPLGHLPTLCIATDVRGSRVSDAWFAALAIEWGCEWITFDRDYARFSGLKWQLPAAP
jgi:predicted nucleic acid-binding protein